MFSGGGGGGGYIVFPTYDAESKSAEIPHLNLPKSPMSSGGRGVMVFPTYDAESKSAKIPYSLCPGGGGGGVSW